jgi:CRP-like cAMP-binding protein
MVMSIRRQIPDGVLMATFSNPVVILQFDKFHQPARKMISMDEIDLTNTLMNIHLFEGASYEQVQRILAAAKQRVLTPGTVLCQPDTIDERLYVFLDGELRIETSDGLKLAAVTEIRIIGEMGVLIGQPRNSRVVAEEASTVLDLHGADLQLIADDEPDLGQRLLINLCKLLYARTHGMNKDLGALQRQKEQIRERLAELAPDDPLAQTEPE